MITKMMRDEMDSVLKKYQHVTTSSCYSQLPRYIKKRIRYIMLAVWLTDKTLQPHIVDDMLNALCQEEDINDVVQHLKAACFPFPSLKDLTAPLSKPPTKLHESPTNDHYNFYTDTNGKTHYPSMRKREGR